MQINFLKQIVEHVAGESAVQIVDLLSSKKDVNEFLIAKKLGLTINQTRNLLYRLSHLGIISSIRKKDKRKGWYIYFWTLNTLKSLEILEEKVEEEIAKYEKELKEKKSKRFYKCKICGVEVTEEVALLQNFGCPECGEIYDLADTELHIQATTKVLTKLKKELSFIKGEREKEQEKEDKKLGKEIKKIETDKKEKRKVARDKRLKDKRKLEKKFGKKLSKKVGKKKISKKKSVKKNIKKKKKSVKKSKRKK